MNDLFFIVEYFGFGVLFNLARVNGIVTQERGSRRRAWCAWERPENLALYLLAADAVALCIALYLAPTSEITALVLMINVMGAGVFTSSVLLRPLIGNSVYGVKDMIKRALLRRRLLR